MLTDEQIRSIITDALGGMDRYTFDEVVYIARAIETAVQDAATVEIEYLKCAVGKQEELTLAAMKGMEIAQRRAAKREAFINQLLDEKSGSDCEAMREALESARVGLRDWETPENRYNALRAIDAALAMREDVPAAFVDVVDSYEGPYNFHGQSLLPVGLHSLYTSPQPAPSAPDGWKLVPVDPTEEMIVAGDYEYDSRGPTSKYIYSAMLAASPEYAA